MSAVTESVDGESSVQASPEQEERFVGVVTRALSWGLDALLINVAAIMAGLGAALVLSIFPLGKSLQPAFEAIAGAIYILWAGAYFVAFWSITGQTPGARVMQIRLVTASRTRVKPARAVVRWIGMNLAMLPLFLGFAPILFRRRGFPDWLAKTLVLDAQQMSLAEARRTSLRARESDRRSGATSPEH